MTGPPRSRSGPAITQQRTITQSIDCKRGLCKFHHGLSLHQNLLLGAFTVVSGNGEVDASRARILIHGAYLAGDRQRIRGGVRVA